MSDDLPLSRPLKASTVPAGGLDVEIVASEAERAALAAANETVSVERFEARLTARPYRGDGIEVTGEVRAATTRLCVVTLEPFAEDVREEVSMRFLPDAPVDGAEEGADDPPDPLVGGQVDLGAIAAEFFTLGLDPYPRKSGAAFESGGAKDDEASPFAALRALKARDDDA